MFADLVAGLVLFKFVSSCYLFLFLILILLLLLLPVVLFLLFLLLLLSVLFLFLFLLLFLVCCSFVVIRCLLFVPVLGLLGVVDVVLCSGHRFIVLTLAAALLGMLWAVVVLVVFVVEVVCRNCFVVAVVLKAMGKP